MLTWIREKFGTAIIGSIIAFIAFVFVFYGVFSPKSTRGLHDGAVAGTVNGDSISISDFTRELNRRIEYFKSLTGGTLSEDQLKAFRLRENVFQGLASRKLMTQEAKRQGLLVADEEVKQKVQEIPAFQKDGKFDFATYKQVLEANHQTPGSFESLVREDLSYQQWQSYFEDRIHVADGEVKKAFLLREDKRKIKYVLLTTEAAKQNVSVDASEIKKFLADPTKLNLAKMKFEQEQKTLYKGQKFEAAQEGIARSILAGEKMEEIQKINGKLADQVLALMSASPASDAKINAILKSSHLEVKKTDWISREKSYVPEIGESKDLWADAFAQKSPIDPSEGGKPKKYLLAGRLLVALVIEAQRPQMAQLEQKSAALHRELEQRKVKDLYQAWMNQLMGKAKIETNPSVVGGSES